MLVRSASSIVTLMVVSVLVGSPGSLNGQMPPEAGPKSAVDLYGDPLPEGALARLGTIRFRHPTNISMLGAMPDGKRVVTMCLQNNVLRTCELDTGKVSNLYDYPTGANANNFSSNRRASIYTLEEGKHLLITGNNFVERIDLENKKQLWRQSVNQGYVICSSMSPDGKWVALLQSGNQNRVSLIATDGGKIAHTIPTGNSRTDVAFTADSKTVSVSGHNQSQGLQSWDVETGKEQPPLKDANAVSISLTYSRNGKWLALGHIHQTITLYDLEARKQAHSFGGLGSTIRWLEFSPDSKYLVALDAAGTLVVFDPEAKTEVRKLSVGMSQALPTFLPDSKRIVTAVSNVVDVWDIEKGESVRPYEGHRGSIHQVVFHPHERWMVTSGLDNTARLWDLNSSAQVVNVSRAGYGGPSVAFTPDGKQLAWSNSFTTIEFLELQKLIEKKDADKPVARELRGQNFTTFALSDDGKTLVANIQNGGAQVWDLAQANPAPRIVPPPFGAQGMPLAYSSDARLSATTYAVDGSGRQVVIADLERTREVARLVGSPQNPVQQGVFAGSRLFVTRALRTLTLWDILSSKVVANVNVSQTNAYATAVTTSPDGRIIAWAESDPDRSIHVHDMLTGETVARFTGHSGLIQTLRLSLNDERPMLASGSADSTVLLWDLRAAMDKVRQNTPKLSPEQAEQIWADLASDDAGAMHRTSWILGTSGADAVRVLAERLQPVPVDRELGPRIQRLTRQMDDDQFAIREQASQEAAELGEAAEPFLREALKSAGSAEVRHRIRRLLQDLSGKPLVLSGDQQRAVRAIQILEEIGSGEAREVLERLSAGEPAARLTQEAKTSLARLAERTERQ